MPSSFRFFSLTLSVGLSTKIKQCQNSNVWGGKVDGRWSDGVVVVILVGEGKKECERTKRRKRESGNSRDPAAVGTSAGLCSGEGR